MKKNRRMARDGNVEVLRCLFMFCIVCYHCFIFGPFSTCKSLWTMCFTVLVCWHTDGFVALSGWYGMKFRWGKVLGLLGHMAFYGALSCLYCWACGIDCSRPYSFFLGGWFGSSYLALMFIAPLINYLVDRSFGPWVVMLVGGWFLVSWGTGRFGAGMLPVKAFGIHSVLLMTYVYAVARTARRMFAETRPRLGLLLGVAAGFVVLLPIFHLVDVLHRQATGAGIYGIGGYFAAFDAPHVVAMAVALVMLFVYYVRLPDWCGKLALKLSPLLFGVYLFHMITPLGYWFYRFEGWCAEAVGGGGFLAVIVTSLAVFAAGLAVDAVRRRMLLGLAAVVRSVGGHACGSWV